jgi:hypothetical protein
VDKKLRLPKDGFIDEQDVEGHRRMANTNVEPEGFAPRDEGDKPHADAALEEDVEGHRIALARNVEDFTILPAPPSYGLNRSPGHGGELTDAEDTEGPGGR